MVMPTDTLGPEMQVVKALRILFENWQIRFVYLPVTVDDQWPHNEPYIFEQFCAVKFWNR